MHLGGIFLWVGIFLHEYQPMLHGIAYGLWFVSMLPIAYELWQIIRSAMNNSQDKNAVPAVAEVGD